MRHSGACYNTPSSGGSCIKDLPKQCPYLGSTERSPKVNTDNVLEVMKGSDVQDY